MSLSENVGLSKFQLAATNLPLSPEPAKARQQLGLALYGLAQFIKGATQYRNDWLSHALDPSQAHFPPAPTDIIELNPAALELMIAEQLNLADKPIVGWDFSPNLAGNLPDSLINNAQPDDEQPPKEAGPAVFEPEFVERTAYLLSELSQAEPESSSTEALLTVDRLDLLLTLVRGEAQRLTAQLQNLQ